ncbi:unnamed protein product [Rhizophagus irregularis]|uniref:Uncharacterized protein n=1 Tax=Rhizophagus irregularis TaxID=588596 RepID=A0A916EC01_9GLOM|nr:unnamed protein product [Rhizophagus irregularis]CAB5378880.1 unnamed protein product [Rhizophagus irregularis]
MIGEYYCNYLLMTGYVCGRTCRRPERCFEHWKAKPASPVRLQDKANADDLIQMKIDELLLELLVNKTEEAGEQG